MVGVTLRGSGRSEGDFELFERQTSDDDAAVGDWITDQTWSSDKGSMAGESSSGITQLMVASCKPKGLVALAPNVP